MADINDVLNGTAGDAYTEITGAYDCATGTPITFNMDGTYKPVDGWEDPETPPPIDGWEQGFYWRYYQTWWLGAGVAGFASSFEAMMHFVNRADSVSKDLNPAWGYAEIGPLVNVTTSGNGILAHWYEYYYIGRYADSPTDIITSQREMSKFPCDPDYDGSDPRMLSTCSTTAPTEDQWPEGNPDYQLSFRNGQFEVSEYDPNALDPAGSLNTKSFCYDAPDGQGGIVTKTGEASTDPANGAPSGGASIYETDEQGNPKPDTVQAFTENGIVIPPDLIPGSDFWDVDTAAKFLSFFKPPV